MNKYPIKSFITFLNSIKNKSIDSSKYEKYRDLYSSWGVGGRNHSPTFLWINSAREHQYLIAGSILIRLFMGMWQPSLKEIRDTVTSRHLIYSFVIWDT